MNNKKNNNKTIIEYIQQIPDLSIKNIDNYLRNVILKVLSSYSTFTNKSLNHLVFLDNNIESISYIIKIPNNKIVFEINESTLGEGGIVVLRPISSIILEEDYGGDTKKHQQFQDYQDQKQQEDNTEYNNLLNLKSILNNIKSQFYKKLQQSPPLLSLPSPTQLPNQDFFNHLNDINNVNDIIKHHWLRNRKVQVKMLGRQFKEFEISIDDVKDILNGRIQSIHNHQGGTHQKSDIYTFKLFIEYLNSSLIYPILNSSSSQLPYYTAEIIYLVDFNDIEIPTIESLTKFKIDSVVNVKFSNDTQTYITKNLGNLNGYLEEFKQISDMFRYRLELSLEFIKFLEKLDFPTTKEVIDYPKLKLFVDNNLQELQYKFKNDILILNHLSLISDCINEIYPTPYKKPQHYNPTPDKDVIESSRKILLGFMDFENTKKDLKERSKNLSISNYSQIEKSITDSRYNLSISFSGFVKLRESLQGRLKNIKLSSRIRALELILYHMNNESLFDASLEMELEFQSYQLESLIKQEQQHRKRFQNTISFYNLPFGFKLPDINNDDEEILINPLTKFLNESIDVDLETPSSEELLKEKHSILEKMYYLDQLTESRPNSESRMEILKVLYENHLEEEEEEKLEDENLKQEVEEEVIINENNEEKIEYSQELFESYQIENEQLKKEFILEISQDEIDSKVQRNNSLITKIESLENEIHRLEEIQSKSSVIVEFKYIMGQLDEIKKPIQADLEILEENIKAKSEYLKQVLDFEQEAKSMKEEQLALADEHDIYKKRVTDLMKSFEEKKSSIQKQLSNYDKEISLQNQNLKSLNEKIKLLTANRKDLDEKLDEKLREKELKIANLTNHIKSLDTIIDLLKLENH